jgi:hypothetical protein
MRRHHRSRLACFVAAVVLALPARAAAQQRLRPQSQWLTRDRAIVYTLGFALFVGFGHDE